MIFFALLFFARYIVTLPIVTLCYYFCSSISTCDLCKREKKRKRKQIKQVNIKLKIYNCGNEYKKSANRAGKKYTKKLLVYY